MAGNEYEQAFDSACAELENLMRQRRDINDRIRALRGTAIALANHLDRNREREAKLVEILEKISTFAPRLTDAIKDALYSAYCKAGPRKLPAIQVKELLGIRGFDFSNLANPLANVHSTLRRLAAQKAIGITTSKMGQTLYWWSGPHYGARTSLANVLEVDHRQAIGMQDKIASCIEKTPKTWNTQQ